VDAGWFRSVGDWRPDPRKFPRGLAALAEEAHRAGLKFGLWVDWAQAGAGGPPPALNVQDPGIRDWLVADPPEGWQPEAFKGMTVDLGLPAAAGWARRETARIVSEYRLDMLEHDGYLVAQGCLRADHPHAPPDPARTTVETEGAWPFVLSSNSADVSLRATSAYYAIQDSLRRAHPGLLLEVCNDGGRMVDFGSAAHGDYFSITDAYDPVSNRRAFFDASHVLPAAMLETYVEKWPAPRMENFLYMLRSGMMGWFTLMQDPSAWSPAERAAARSELSFYKEKLRPLVRSADLYHLSPRPDGEGWDSLEYFDPAGRSGAVYVFRGANPAPDAFRIALQGLRADRRYRLRFRDHPSGDATVEGARLRGGLAVRLPVPNSSEIVLFREVPDQAAQKE
jgi:Melibiase